MCRPTSNSAASSAWLLGCLALALAARAQPPPTCARLQRLFRLHLGEAPHFRLLYRLRAPPESILVQEAHSQALLAGALLSQPELRPAAAAAATSAEFNGFQWRNDLRYQWNTWIRPFTCHSVQNSLDSQPIASGLLEPHLPGQLRPLLARLLPQAGNQTRILYGLSAILTAVFEPAWSQRLSSDGQSCLLEMAPEARPDNPMARAISEPPTGLTLSLQAPDADSLTGLNVSVLGPQERVLAQFQLLKLDHQPGPFAQLLHLPMGYGCLSSGPLEELPFLLKLAPSLVSAGTPFMSYQLELNLLTSAADQRPQPARQSNSSRPEPTASLASHALHTPLQSMRDPLLRTWRLTFLRDRSPRNRMMALVSPDRLLYWDLETRQGYSVQRHPSGPDQCRGPTWFGPALPEAAACATGSGPQLSLGNGWTLALHHRALQLIEFTLASVHNQFHLMHQRQLGPDLWQLTYEQDIFLVQPLIRYCPADGLTEPPPGALNELLVRLISTYHYEPTIRSWSPKNASLLMFNQQLTQLRLQLDITMLRRSTFDPWLTGPRQLIDLSPCRQSARLELQYELEDDLEYLAPIEEPHHLLRLMLSAHFQNEYLIEPARIPYIQVDIQQNLLLIQIQLLEKSHILHDARPMARLTLSDPEDEQLYLAHLQHSATSSAMLFSREACAKHCQQRPLCLAYIFCPSLQSCFIMTNHSDWFLNQPELVGSLLGPNIRCDAFRLALDEAPILIERRKNSWSLEDILDNVVQLVVSPPTQPTISKQLQPPNLKLGYWNGNSSQIRELIPKYAHYFYDNQFENPSSIENEQNLHEELVDALLFQVALSGHRFVSQMDLTYEHISWHHLDLEDNGGYLIINNYSLDDCSRLCLGDILCSSFSYCTTSKICALTSLNQTGIEFLLGADENVTNLSGQTNGKVLDDLIMIRKIRLEQNSGCVIMKRTYSDQFDRLEHHINPAINKNSLLLNIIYVSSAEDCASNCVMMKHYYGSKEYDCLSYEFCVTQEEDSEDISNSECYLYRSHLITDSNVTASFAQNVAIKPIDSDNHNSTRNNANCWHYARQFLANYHKLSNRQLPAKFKTVTTKISDPTWGDTSESSVSSSDYEQEVSLMNCARQCEEHSECGAFEYCSADKQQSSPNTNSFYQSCSLGSSKTLEMLPTIETGNNEDNNNDKNDHLLHSDICSVYVYKNLGLVLANKRKKKALIAEQRNEADLLAKNHLNLSILFKWRLFVLFSVSFLISFMVCHFKMNQFSFKRFNNMLDLSGRDTSFLRSTEVVIQPEQEPNENYELRNVDSPEQEGK